MTRGTGLTISPIPGHHPSDNVHKPTTTAVLLHIIHLTHTATPPTTMPRDKAYSPDPDDVDVEMDEDDLDAPTNSRDKGKGKANGVSYDAVCSCNPDRPYAQR
jgi:hypothetical protein